MTQPNQSPHIKNPGISRWPFFIVFGAAALAFIMAGYWFYLHETDTIKRDKYNELKAIAKLKSDQIVSWRQERIGDTRLTAMTPFLKSMVAEWMNTPGNSELKTAITYRLQLLADIYHYDNVMLSDVDGKILLSLDPRLTALDANARQLVDRANSLNDVIFGDLFRCPECNRIHLDVAAPMVDEKNRSVAVLILRIDPELFLFRMIQSWPMPSRSAETLLVRTDGEDALFLNPLRFRSDTALNFRIPLTRTDVPAVQAALGKTGLFEGKDYRGIDVLTDIRPVPDSPWFMVAKMDADEIFAEAHQRAILTSLLTFMLVLLSGVGAAFIYKHKGKRAFQTLYRMEREKNQAQETIRIISETQSRLLQTDDIVEIYRLVAQKVHELLGAGIVITTILDEPTQTTRMVAYYGLSLPIQRIIEMLGTDPTKTSYSLKDMTEDELQSFRSGRLERLDGGTYALGTRKIPKALCEMVEKLLGVKNVYTMGFTAQGIHLGGLSILAKGDISAKKDAITMIMNQAATTINRIRTQEALSVSEEKFRKAFLTSPDSIVITRLVDGMFVLANQGFFEISGYTQEEILGKTSLDINIYTNPEDRKKIIEKLSMEGTVKNFESVFRKKNGDIVFGLMSASIIHLNGVPHVLTITRDITIRKRAEENLRKSEEKYRIIAENMADIITILDMNLRFTYVSPSIKRMRGFTVEEAMAQTMDQVMTPDSLQLISKVFEEELRLEATGTADPGRIRIMELEEYRKDGSIAWIENTLSFLRDENQKPVGILAVARDITERKQAEDALRASESRFRQLYQHSPVAYQSMDVKGNIVEVNAAWLTELGYALDEVIGKWFGDFLAGDGPDVFPSRFEAFKAAGEVHGSEFDMKRKNGTIISVSFEGRVGRGAAGTFERTHCVFVNITERKQKEEMLRFMTSRQDALLSAIPDIIMEVDINKVYTWANPAGFEFFGDDVIGNDAGYYFEGEQDTYKEVQPLFDGAEDVIYVESWQRRKDGKKRLLAWWCKVLKDENGNAAGALSSARDITDQQTLENQFQQAQKMESVGRLAGGVAHDFNNMLGVIIGHAEMALEQVDSAQPLHADLLEIRKAAQRSADLTRHLLAFARRQTVSPVVLDLNDTISGMLKMLRRLIGEDIDLVWKPGHGLWTVKIDPVQIDQILANLLVNARDAIAGVGDVTIETDNVTFDETYCESHAGFICGRFVMMAVSDSGTGMDKETLEHIFEPFFTTKDVGKGTGLGLATIYGIVKQNNGFINVYSEPGKGTSFKIYLPEAAEPVETPKVDFPRKDLHGSETVLLVEDEEAILKLGKSILQRYGYTVLAAMSPHEALSLAQNHQGKIHLLITDVVMPEMNGKELKEVLVHLYPQIKCLFMSGYTANAIAHHGVLDEGVNFLQKPFSVKTMAEMVRKTLEEV